MEVIIGTLECVFSRSIGVAMANSQQRIIDVADYVTDSNFDCGVAKAIEKFLL